jgi:hypothetical protein
LVGTYSYPSADKPAFALNEVETYVSASAGKEERLRQSRSGVPHVRDYSLELEVKGKKEGRQKEGTIAE